jgi:hypothetical protein
MVTILRARFLRLGPSTHLQGVGNYMASSEVAASAIMWGFAGYLGEAAPYLR